MRKRMLKNEKGSITLFVLLAILFFVIIVFGLFISSSNKNVIQSSELDKIKEEYQESINNINQIYNDTVSKVEKPASGEGNNFDMSNGVIEIEFLEGTSYNITQTPNHPALKSGMTAITYNSNGTVNTVSNSNGTDWYSYVAGSGTSDNNASRWANAKVTVNNVDSYFVWIPRYAYRIIYFDSSTSKEQYKEGTLSEEDAIAKGKIVGYSDSRGIVDTEGRTKPGVSVQTEVPIGRKRFKTHPVFDGDVNYGGWAEDDGTPVKLQGIWVAKYEASSVEGNSNSESGDNVTTKHIKIQPGVQSWRNISIENMFINAKNYNQSLNSHLLKNSEWGAVAYLTESKYGRNGTEIATNNNNLYITGSSDGYTNSLDTSYEYNTSNGKLASTTGNIYGIYDLSGGAWEYVSGYLKNGNYSYANTTFTNGTSNAYSTVYEAKSENEDEVIPPEEYTKILTLKYGDATYETSGWHNDTARFGGKNLPFFVRGGDYSHKSLRGVFFFSSNKGIFYNYSSFRICLIVT